jgi:hypothetical protein
MQDTPRVSISEDDIGRFERKDIKKTKHSRKMTLTNNQSKVTYTAYAYELYHQFSSLK